MSIFKVLRENQDTINAMARPVTMYLSGLATTVALFVPAVVADKMWVTAALAGGTAIARSIDKKTTVVTQEQTGVAPPPAEKRLPPQPPAGKQEEP